MTELVSHEIRIVAIRTLEGWTVRGRKKNRYDTKWLEVIFHLNPEIEKGSRKRLEEALRTTAKLAVDKLYDPKTAEEAENG